MPAARRVGTDATDDDVIDQVDVHGFRRFAELTRELEIGGARRRITAGVIVRADHGGRGFANRLAEHFARVGEGGSCCARTHLDAFQQSILPIQTQYPKFLHLETLHEWLEKRADEICAIEQRCFAGGMTRDAASDFHDGDKLQRLHVTDASEPPKLRLLPRNQSGERTGFVNKSG